jgi:hypothetical protein
MLDSNLLPFLLYFLDFLVGRQGYLSHGSPWRLPFPLWYLKVLPSIPYLSVMFLDY